jgi:hypothetical protein
VVRHDVACRRQNVLKTAKNAKISTSGAILGGKTPKYFSETGKYENKRVFPMDIDP